MTYFEDFDLAEFDEFERRVQELLISIGALAEVGPIGDEDTRFLFDKKANAVFEFLFDKSIDEDGEQQRRDIDDEQRIRIDLNQSDLDTIAILAKNLIPRIAIVNMPDEVKAPAEAMYLFLHNRRRAIKPQE